MKGLKGFEQDSVKVMFNASKVKTNFNEQEVTLDEINKAIEDVGYEVLKSKARAV